eukprot:1523425-Pleurochrysis_carterae.AAC.2
MYRERKYLRDCALEPVESGAICELHCALQVGARRNRRNDRVQPRAAVDAVATAGTYSDGSGATASRRQL